jgi:hypothetical protein
MLTEYEDLRPTDCAAEQFARIKAAYVTVRLLQRYDRIENAETPPDGPMRFHHTIENRSGSGVQVRLHEADADPSAP